MSDLEAIVLIVRLLAYAAAEPLCPAPAHEVLSGPKVHYVCDSERYLDRHARGVPGYETLPPSRPVTLAISRRGALKGLATGLEVYRLADPPAVGDDGRHGAAGPGATRVHLALALAAPGRVHAIVQGIDLARHGAATRLRFNTASPDGETPARLEEHLIVRLDADGRHGYGELAHPIEADDGAYVHPAQAHRLREVGPGPMIAAAVGAWRCRAADAAAAARAHIDWVRQEAYGM